MNDSVYLYGQILGTHSFFLKDGFLRPDEYSEISEKYFLPGGETGTAATVLASLGEKVKIDGTHIGTQVAGMLKKFYEGKPFVTIDCKHDTYLHQHCAVNIVSKECTGTDYAGIEEVRKFLEGGAYV